MALYIGAVILSEIEGTIWYWLGNISMATTQIRLTSLLTSVTAILLAYRYLHQHTMEVKPNLFNRILLIIGNCSFGIYLSHVLIIQMLGTLPAFERMPFPISFIITIIVTTVIVAICSRILPPKWRAAFGMETQH